MRAAGCCRLSLATQMRQLAQQFVAEDASLAHSPCLERVSALLIVHALFSRARAPAPLLAPRGKTSSIVEIA
eukprot:6172157-Pleurochrysis_carterae.AAC.2